MHEVKKICNYMMTRHILLYNIDYKTEDYCFDDSDLIPGVDFSFMEVGEKYDCKIRLLGNVLTSEESDALLCKVLSICKIGKRDFCKVKTECGIYFIDYDEVCKYRNVTESDEFFFSFFRKDLVQVDGVIYGYYL